MIGPLAKRERIRRQAARWFARMQGPDAERDRSAFVQWYERDSRHAEAYDRMGRHWRAAAQLGMPRVAPPFEPAAVDHRRRPPRMMLAASIAAILAIGTVVAVNVLPPFVASGQAQQIRLETRTGEIRAIRLVDGTRLTLDTHTVAIVRFDSAERVVRLEQGRIRIVWVRDPRPLRIIAREMLDIAPAGVLDVSLEGDRAVLSAISGPLDIKVGSTPVRLDEGRALTLAVDGAAPAVTVQVAADPRWPDGVLDFAAEPLDRAIARANRYSDVKLTLDRPDLAGERVTGRYRAGDTAGLAASLAAAFDLDIKRQSDGSLRLERRPGRSPQ